jgi:hypothetical protein
VNISNAPAPGSSGFKKAFESSISSSDETLGSGWREAHIESASNIGSTVNVDVDYRVFGQSSELTRRMVLRDDTEFSHFDRWVVG